VLGVGAETLLAISLETIVGLTAMDEGENAFETQIMAIKIQWDNETRTPSACRSSIHLNRE